MATSKGWSGKILRVNLTTETITTEDTAKYTDFIGGMGFGYKVMWDEVPEGTKSYDPENKIIFGVGPFTGTGIPCSSRTNITSLMPTHNHLIGDSHMGGHFAAELKYAGWDSIIVEGKASSPVWLRIENDSVTIEDASRIWGQGTVQSTADVCSIMGAEAHVAAIGPAGENMVNQAIIITGGSHSAGGHGGVMGSKNLKAIGVKGTLPVYMGGTKEALIDLDRHAMSIIGSNNQHVVPSTPMPWAEYHHNRSRWTARPGLFWGNANPPVETGECPPEDMNSVGLRCQKGVFDHGDIAEDYTTRMGGCQSCPIRCHSQLEVPEAEEYGVSRFAANTCVGWSFPRSIMLKGYKDGSTGRGTKEALIATVVSSNLADDWGLWCNYNQISRDFRYAYDNGILEKVLPAEEYNSIPWDLLEAGDPNFLHEFYRRVSTKEGEFSHLGDGSFSVSKRWNFGDDYYSAATWRLFNPVLGFPQHHSSETAGQVGALINLMFNRDAQCHSHVNFTGSGLPIEVQKEIAGEIWGSPDALDAPADYTRMNPYKANFAKYSIVRNVLHDSLTLCNWMWPLQVSPHKERNYLGDTALEAKFFSLITGIEKTEAELDLDAERIFTLHRALTVKQMGTTDMRNKHDVIADYVFDRDPDVEPFTSGTIKMEREDMEVAKTMFYEAMGWDADTGAPTRACLERLGMGYVADELEAKGLLPA